MYQEKQVLAIIVAAGKGTRMKIDVPKQFLKIDSKTMIEKTASKFDKNRYVDGFFVASDAEHLDYTKELLCNMLKLRGVVEGGETRQESVWNVLENIEENAIVLVHDGARPYVSDEIIESVISATYQFGAAIPVVEVSDTVKSIVALDDENVFVKSSIDRSMLRCAQTPQGFYAELLKNAHKYAQKNNIEATDDAMLVEIIGEQVYAVSGERKNIKITRKEDMPEGIRIGSGFDAHRLKAGVPLYLGGEKIPYEKGLTGHSDADVLAHAIIDALLGAAHLGDIGKLFPDTSDEYKGIRSIKLLERVGKLLCERGFRITNIDATVICEKPKLSPFIQKMERNIAKALKIEEEQVNVKATTTEGMGYAGRGEGIAATAICLIESIYK
ncbi:MAG: 2-C-methyl-D-erythritol 4-phosphate cytidylyltransferase [Eubacteriales bacterium]